MRTMKPLAMLLLCLATVRAWSQDIGVPEAAVADATALERAIPDLAQQALGRIPPTDALTRLEYQFCLQLAAGQYAQASATFDELQKARPAPPAGQWVDPLLRQELFARSKALEASEKISYAEAFTRTLERKLATLDNRAAAESAWTLGALPANFRTGLQQRLQQLNGRKTVTFAEALDLVRWRTQALALESFAPSLDAAVAVDEAKRYVIDRGVLIRTPDGATLTADVVRAKGASTPQPAALTFTIYADPPSYTRELTRTADNGYAAVYVYARGKYRSTDEIRPWETEARDTYAAIDWISKQPWCNGKVGMYGGSYSGFVQWAALKNPHPALKTIVPSAASFPINGLPIQNGVAVGANYAWPFYVMDNRFLDNETYFQNARWSSLLRTWYESGRPWREIDAIDGKPNPLLQKQLLHPSLDAYWQAMQPYEKDYAKINIPVLTLTGYFDDANSAAINYLVDHYRYNKNAEHYLVIGPYRHPAISTMWDAVVGGYAIDPIAQFDCFTLIYEWFDYVMKGAPKPALLKDRINYQVMGANLWRHAPSIEKMADRHIKFYLTNTEAGSRYQLSSRKPATRGYVSQRVDLADRKTSNNLYPTGAYYTGSPDSPTHITYVSELFKEPVSVDGLITGKLDVTLDRKDFDFTWALYEETPEGKYFKLAYYLGRASYASDLTKRKLVTPGKAAILPFTRTSLVSRQLSKGSRLLLLLTVNKNENSQVNYGTGKDVSDESIADAKQPLHVQWHNDSYINVPVRGGAQASVNTTGEAT
jgi:putative CocE/NonD family hydrolase